MFAKNKVTQSMIDAVNQVLNEDEKKRLINDAEIDETGFHKAAHAAKRANQSHFEFQGKKYPVTAKSHKEAIEMDEASLKIPTSTGTKVLGRGYGNSAKAHEVQHKNPFEKGPSKSDLKGIKAPTKKELKSIGEEDLSEAGDCVTEPQAKKIAKKEVKGHEKSLHKESFANKLLTHVRENKSAHPEEIFTDNNLGEEEMSDKQMKKREKIVLSMKKGEAGFKQRYGKNWKNVMYATATKQAMKEDSSDTWNGSYDFVISEKAEDVEIDEGIVDKIRGKNYERLAKRSYDKTIRGTNFSADNQQARDRTVKAKELGVNPKKLQKYNDELDEARMSAAAKLSKAFDKEQLRSAAARRAGQELLLGQTPKKQGLPFDPDKKSPFKTKNNPNRTGVDIVKALAQKGMNNEEVEELDEISKKTQASYARKSMQDLAQTTHVRSALQQQKMQGTMHPDHEKEKTIDNLTKISNNRQKGLHRVMDRLAKEEVELDEDVMTHITLGKKVKNGEGGHDQTVHHKGEHIGNIHSYAHIDYETGKKTGRTKYATSDKYGDTMTVGHITSEEGIDELRWVHAQNKKDKKTQKEEVDLDEGDAQYKKNAGTKPMTDLIDRKKTVKDLMKGRKYFGTGKVKEEVELEEEHKVGDTVIVNSKFFGKQKGKVTKVDGQSIHVQRDGKKASEKYPHDAVMKEEFEELDETVDVVQDKNAHKITTDMLSGRVPGGKLNSFKNFKVNLVTSGEEDIPKNVEKGEDTKEKQKISTNPGPVDIKLDDKLTGPTPYTHFKDQKSVTSESVELTESALEKFLSQKGIEMKSLSYASKIAYSKSNEFLKWRQNHQMEEVEMKQNPSEHAIKSATNAMKRLKKETMMGKISN